MNKKLFLCVAIAAVVASFSARAQVDWASLDAYQGTVTADTFSRLLNEALALNHRVDELGVTGCEFEASHVEVPLLDDTGDAAVIPGQGGGVDGIVTHERRTGELRDDVVLEEFLDQSTRDPTGVEVDLCRCAQIRQLGPRRLRGGQASVNKRGWRRPDMVRDIFEREAESDKRRKPQRDQG